MVNKLCWIKFEKCVDASKSPTTCLISKVRFFKKYIFTLHFAVQITMKQEKRTIYCSLHYVHESNEKCHYLHFRKKNRAYLFVKTGKSRLFQITLFLSPIIFDRTAVYLSLFGLLKIYKYIVL